MFLQKCVKLVPIYFLTNLFLRLQKYLNKVLKKINKPPRGRRKLCTSQLKPPPFGSRGRIGDNRGIRSLLNNKLSPGGGSFD